MEHDEQFRSFVDEHGARMLHAARLLTGDHHRGEDLLQTVLIRVHQRWRRIDDPAAYTRAALVTAHIDSTRRRWWGERPTEHLPETADPADSDRADDRADLRVLLAELPPQERAVVVLRYYLDLSEQETAASLNLPIGTVKSTAHRALSRLRVTAAHT